MAKRSRKSKNILLPGKKLWTPKKEMYPRVLIYVPLPKYMNSIPFHAFWNIAKRGYPIIEIPPVRCDDGRNIAAAESRNTAATHICLLDVDHIHQPDVVDKFSRHVIADRSKKVICGFQYRRSPPFNPCVYVQGEDDEFYWLHERPEDALIEVQGVSAASMLIAVDVFREIPAPWWAYTYDHAEENKYPGTDGYFSKKMRENNVKMWVDTSVTSPHLDNAGVITEQTYKTYCEREAQFRETNKDSGLQIPDIKTKVKIK